jgi:hypothetical protein
VYRLLCFHAIEVCEIPELFGSGHRPRIDAKPESYLGIPLKAFFSCSICE